MAFQAIGKFFYNYELRDGAIEIVILGGVPIKSIPLSEIDEMTEVSLKDTLTPDFKTLRLGNRLMGRILKIKRKSGLFRYILITPDEPDKFLHAWRSAKTN